MANYSFVSKKLSPLKKFRFLKNFCVFDIETNEWLDDTKGKDRKLVESYHDKPIQAFLLVYYDGKDIKYYSGKSCLVDFLKDFLVFSNRDRVCFSHNGGKFDILALYEAFRSDDDLLSRFTFNPIMQGSRIMSFRIWDKNRHKWEFRDSFSLLPRSLEALCQSFKPDHRKLKRPKVSFSEAKQEWIKYCSNDCLSLYDIIKQFNSVIEDVRGSVGYTIASTALSTFRKRFLTQSLECYHKYNNFFRSAYFGGRTEIFNLHADPKNSPFYLYDVNSMYPFVMRNWKYPIGKPIKVNYSDPSECKGKSGIMECLVFSPPDLNIPLLPFHRDDGKLIFPLGSWRGVYEFSLIEEALRYGYDIRPLRTWEFEDSFLFKGYVDHFYGLKNNSEGAEREIYKFLLNSLYGKWGELPKRKRLITDPDVSLEGKLPFDPVFGYALEEYEQNSAHHLPAISIRVTALAQVHLYRLFWEIIRRGGTIYYCDTDSVVTDIRLPTSPDLGDIGLQLCFEEGIFLLPKTYILRSFDRDSLGNDLIVKTKGFSKDFKDHVSNIDLWKKALCDKDFSPFFEEKVRPASLNEIRIRHLSGFVTLIEKKSIISSYDKRKVLPDFGTVPLVLDEKSKIFHRESTNSVRLKIDLI